MKVDKAFDQITGSPFRFVGDFKALETFARKEIGKGRWVSDGSLKLFRHHSGAYTLTWNTESGAVQHIHGYWGPIRRKVLDLPRRARGWTVLRKGPFAGLTLPQAFFEQPLECIEYCTREKPLRAELQTEADELTTKVQCIRVPNASPNVGIAHYFGPHDRYDGFEIIRRGEPIKHAQGRVIIDRVIDFWVPFMMTMNDGDIDRAADCLMRVLGERRSQGWERRKCDAFFEDDDNFAIRRRRAERKIAA